MNLPETLRNKSLSLLADGFAQDFVDNVITDERYIDTMMEVVMDFIDNNIPIVNDEDKLELAFMLVDSVTLVKQG